MKGPITLPFVRMIRPLLAVCVIVLAGTSFAQDRDKKLIEWGWDEPDSKFIRANIETMEQFPFDGLIFHVLSSKAGNFTWEMWGSRKFELAESRHSIDNLQALENARNSPTSRRPPSGTKAMSFRAVNCAGTYPHHLQGICTNDRDAVYWCFTTTLVKTDTAGNLLKQIPVRNHHGDLCHRDGKIYVAVNLGRFNDPAGHADSWVYVYQADDLSFLSKHKTPEVFHGAGGVGHQRGHFFVVGGLPDDVNENYVYEYDTDFRFVKRHVIKSGHTRLGIQTATFSRDHWWFGCYGDSKVMLKTDADFKMKGRYEFNCSLGIVGLPDGRFLAASGRCEKGKGCRGRAVVAVADERRGLAVKAE